MLPVRFLMALLLEWNVDFQELAPPFVDAVAFPFHALAMIGKWCGITLWYAVSLLLHLVIVSAILLPTWLVWVKMLLAIRAYVRNRSEAERCKREMEPSLVLKGKHAPREISDGLTARYNVERYLASLEKTRPGYVPFILCTLGLFASYGSVFLRRGVSAYVATAVSGASGLAFLYCIMAWFCSLFYRWFSHPVKRVLEMVPGPKVLGTSPTGLTIKDFNSDGALMHSGLLPPAEDVVSDTSSDERDSSDVEQVSYPRNAVPPPDVYSDGKYHKVDEELVDVETEDGCTTTITTATTTRSSSPINEGKKKKFLRYNVEGDKKLGRFVDSLLDEMYNIAEGESEDAFDAFYDEVEQNVHSGDAGIILAKAYRHYKRSYRDVSDVGDLRDEALPISTSAAPSPPEHPKKIKREARLAKEHKPYSSYPLYDKDGQLVCACVGINQWLVVPTHAVDRAVSYKVNGISFIIPKGAKRNTFGDICVMDVAFQGRGLRLQNLVNLADLGDYVGQDVFFNDVVNLHKTSYATYLGDCNAKYSSDAGSCGTPVVSGEKVLGLHSSTNGLVNSFAPFTNDLLRFFRDGRQPSGPSTPPVKDVHPSTTTEGRIGRTRHRNRGGKRGSGAQASPKN